MSGMGARVDLWQNITLLQGFWGKISHFCKVFGVEYHTFAKFLGWNITLLQGFWGKIRKMGVEITSGIC